MIFLYFLLVDDGAGPVRWGEEIFMSAKILLIGFGNVGRSLISLIDDKRTMLKRDFGVELSVVGVGTRSSGGIFNSGGVSFRDLMKSDVFAGRLNSLSDDVGVNASIDELIDKAEYDIMVETTPYRLDNGDSGPFFIESALRRGKHVVTSNKGPLFYRFGNISELARANGVRCLFEGAVMSGTPLFSFVHECLRGCKILGFEGVLNGTSNYILSLMSKGTGFDDALFEAKRRGYAESDPSLDIEGWDSAVKASIIAQALMEAPFIPLSDMDIQGIRSVKPKMFDEARRYGGSLKLIAAVEKREGRNLISVRPAVLPPNHPLHSISGITNGALFITDSIGEVCVTGAGAGARQTAYAIFRDIVTICMKEG